MGYQYGYDGAAQLLQGTATISGSTSPIDAYAYRYDAARNRLVEQVNSSVTTSAYNELNQLTSRAGGGVLTISGSLSQYGTVSVPGVAPYVTGSLSTNFSLAVPVVAGSNNIQISATNANNHGATHTLQVNVTSDTPIPSLTYDADGNLTSDGTFNYVFDSANRLVKIWYGTSGSSASTTMSYDGLGRRSQIIEANSAGTITSTKNLVWDGMGICEEKNASDAVTKAYFAQGVRLGGSNYYYTQDHLGSIREVMDAGGNVQARYAYDPYGRQTQLSGTMAFDFGYTGQYYHQPSGLMMAPYREYSAGLGRWISRDPIGENGGINLYGYVGNDIINAVDPSGLADIKVNGQIWQTPIAGDAGHPHLFNGVDQGLHLHGPDGSKYFPSTNMMLDSNGEWSNAGNKFRKQFQKAARCQLNDRMLGALGLASLLAAFIIDDTTGQTDQNIQNAINDLNKFQNSSPDDQNYYASSAAQDISNAFQNDIPATIIYGNLMGNK